MFYYLLHNSSFIKTGELKERLISTLIYGSVIYIIIHALLSFTNKKNLITYFWFLFMLDCIVFFVKNDWNFYTTTLNNIEIKPKKKKKKVIEQDISSDIETETENEDIIDEYIMKKKNKVRFNDSKNEVTQFKKDEPSKKVNKKNKKSKNIIKSTDIKSIIKKNDDNNLKLNNLPIEELNLTLENLELIQNELPNSSDINSVNSGGSSSIDEIQRDFLKKKMEDEVSDPGSDIDLEQFENSIIND